ncbi:MAG: DUF6569 family protein [Gemmataceae bacterium]
MSQVVTDLFASVDVVEPQEAGGLQVFGLRFTPPKPHDYVTLDEALATKSLTVSEVSESGSVPTLKLTNATGKRVFLMAGEQLVGAKQNRVLNTSLLVEVGAELPVPVSCVEQGRWAYRSQNFGSVGTASHGNLRKLMTRQVSGSYVRFSAPLSHQGEVWQEVSRALSSHGSVSGSHALEQVYEDKRTDLDAAVQSLATPEGCNGAVFALRGKVVGADLFDRPDTFKKLWPKLVRAYALDALEAPDAAKKAVTPAEVAAWLGQSRDAVVKSFPSPALGQDVRFESPGLIGAGLIVEDTPIHVQAFREG